MIRYLKIISLALALLLAQRLLAQSNFGQNISLNTANSGGVYMGSQVISMQAGFSFSATNGNSFVALTSNVPNPAQINTMATDNGYGTANTNQSGRILNPTAPVGAIPGSFAVSPTGAAVYSVPIQVVPGTGGIQPNLAVVYNSQTGSGILGKGWQLSGLSSIVTVPHNNTGLFFPKNEDYTFKCYMLDGQPLMVDYGPNQDIISYDFTLPETKQFYKTETNTYRSIVKYNNVFTVTSPDGTVRTYGSTDNSRLSNSQWLLDKVTDCLGNYMTFTYQTINGQTMLAAISYTGNAVKGIAPFATVSFSYGERSDKNFSLNPFYSTQNYLLRGISVSENGALVRSYSFSYSSSPAGSLLANIGLQSASGETLNDTHFVWNMPEETTMIETALDDATKTDWGVFNTTRKQISVPNVDDDAKTDVLTYWTENNAVKIEVRSSKTKSVLVSTSCPNNGMEIDVEPADFNGDGLSDIVVRFDSPVVFPQPGRCMYVFLSPSYSSPVFIDLPDEKSVYDIGDYNKDGRDEHVTVYGNSDGKLYLHQIFFDTNFNLFPTDDFFPTPTTLNAADIVDLKFGNFTFNSGRQCLAVYHQRANSILLSLPENHSINTAPASLPTESRVLCVGDFNADGLSDILLTPKGEGCASYRIGILRGNAFDFSLYNGGSSVPLDLGTISAVYPSLEHINSLFERLYHEQIKQTVESYIGYYKYSIKASLKNNADINNHTTASILDLNNDGFEDVWISRALACTIPYSIELNIYDAMWGPITIGTPLKDVYNNITNIDFNFFYTQHIDILMINQRNGTYKAVNKIHLVSYEMQDNYISFKAGDFDGDGMVDVVYRSGDSVPSGTTAYEYGYLHASSDFTKTQVAQISDGENNLTNVTYGSLLSTSLHTPLSNPNPSQTSFARITESAYAQPSDWQVQMQIAQVNETTGVKSLLAPLQLVQSFSQKNTALSASVNTTLKYSGARMATDGRGFLGFYSMQTSVDGGGLLPNETSTTYYDLDSRKHPYISKVDQFYSDGALKQSSSSTLKELQDPWDKRVYYPFVERSTTTEGLTATVKTVVQNQSFTDVFVDDEQSHIYSQPQLNSQIASNGVEEITTEYSSPNNPLFDATALVTTTNTIKKIAAASTVVAKEEVNYKDHVVESIKNYRDGVLLTTTKIKTEGNIVSTTVTPADATNSVPSRTTSVTFDPTLRYAIRSTDPQGNAVNTKYNTALGVATSISDEAHPALPPTVHTYSSLGELQQSTLPGGEVLTYKLDRGANATTIRTITSTWQPAVSETFDFLGRKVAASSTLYGGTTGSYTNNISLTQAVESNSGAKDITTTFDAYGRAKKITQGSYTKDYSYTGKLVSQTENNLVSRSTRFDATGKIVSVSDPLSTQTTFSYDASGRLSETKNGADPAIANKYNSLGQTELKDPDAGTSSYKYNGYGELYSQTDANGNKTENTYDVLGRVLKRTITPASGTVYTIENTWDTKYLGALSKVEQKSVGALTASIEYEYNNIGLCTMKTQTSGAKVLSFSYEYNSKNQLQYITYPNQLRLQYWYNSNNDFWKITNTADNSVVWQLTATDNGKITGSKHGAYLCSRAYQTNTSYISSIQAGTVSATTSILNLGFVWDEKTGNLSSRTDYRITNKTESFGYDKLDRLTGITPSGGSLQTFEYGATGNITLHPQLGVFAYGAAQPHALTNVPKTNYVPTNQTITYNAIGKAATISQTLASGTAGYTISYNPDGERCQTVYSFTGQSSITRYYFDDYEQTDIGGVLTDYCYIYSPEGLVALYKGGQMYYVFTDHLGSIAAIANASGTITERYSYDAWGRPRNADTWTPLATDNAYEPARITNRGYTGHEHLFTFGLINMNGRMYDPVLGRFLSPDNYVQSPYNSQNYNRYAYCLNNPLKYTDPTGDLFWVIVAAVAVLSGTLNLAANMDNVHNFGDAAYYFGVGAAVGAGATIGGAALAPVLGTGAIAGAALGGASGFVTGFANTAYATNGDWSAALSAGGKGALFGAITGGIIAGTAMGLSGRNVWTGEMPSNGASVFSLHDAFDTRSGPSFNFKHAYRLNNKDFWKYGHTNRNSVKFQQDGNGNLVGRQARKDALAGESFSDPSYQIEGNTVQNTDGTYSTTISKDPSQQMVQAYPKEGCYYGEITIQTLNDKVILTTQLRPSIFYLEGNVPNVPVPSYNFFNIFQIGR